MRPHLMRLTHNIYALSGDQRRVRPWLGVVVTAEGTVLIDSGNGPLHAADMQAALSEISAPPVTHILLTHHHWDHVFGSASFPGATIIAHEATQHHLRVIAGEPWSADYNLLKAGESQGARLTAALMNKAVPDWQTFRAFPAHQTFTEPFDLNFGGYHFRLVHIGGAHEPDSCVVSVTPGNVLFVGDIPYGSVRGDHAPEALQRDLDAINAFEAEWVVEGHRRPSPGPDFSARFQ